MSPEFKAGFWKGVQKGTFIMAMISIGVAAVLLAARWVQLLINWMEIT